MGNTDKFEMIASVYDTPERIHIAQVSSDAIRKYIAADAKNKRAIDFGCGTGLVGLNLIDDFESVLFLDTSPGMIGQIQQKIADLGIQNAETLCFDFEGEGLSELRTDYIFMAQVLLHIKDVEFLLARLFGVLNEGGHLLIVDFDKNEHVVSDLLHNGFNQAELADLMIRVGYKNVRSETFYSGSKLFMAQDASMFVLDSQK